MQTRSITIRVSSEAARTYRAATAGERRKLDALLSLKLSEIARRPSSLEQVMREVSGKAQERGLTPEILDELLDER